MLLGRGKRRMDDAAAAADREPRQLSERRPSPLAQTLLHPSLAREETDDEDDDADACP